MGIRRQVHDRYKKVKKDLYGISALRHIASAAFQNAAYKKKKRNGKGLSLDN
jgi:hypothetical protein